MKVGDLVENLPERDSVGIIVAKVTYNRGLGILWRVLWADGSPSTVEDTEFLEVLDESR